MFSYQEINNLTALKNDAGGNLIMDAFNLVSSAYTRTIGKVIKF
jgi:hypothetical protein